MEQIKLDGKIGGGSVLRVGVPLAIALGKSLHITNVRHQRRRRGIQVQHLTGIELVASLTGSNLVGAHVGSTEVLVTPGNQEIDVSYLPQINIPTSGAVSLVYQTLSNYVFATKSPAGFAFVGGGTHVNWSPNFDVLMHVNNPLFRLFGVQTHIQLSRPGFYPTGGAIGKIFMEPINFDKVNLDGGKLTKHTVVSHASSSLKSKRIAERQVKGYKTLLQPDESVIGYAEADSKGAALSSILKFDSGTFKAVARIYQSKIDAEDLGKQTAKAAKREIESPAAVDEQLADQLIVPLAFSPKGSSYTFEKIYPHVRTNIAVVEALMGNIFNVEEREGYVSIERI